MSGNVRRHSPGTQVWFYEGGSYRRPAMTDVRAEASLDASEIARIKREADTAGKTEFVLDAELTDTAGVVVATTRGTYQVRIM